MKILRKAAKEAQEQVDFEAGFLAGAGLCVGITYAVNDGDR